MPVMPGVKGFANPLFAMWFAAFLVLERKPRWQGIDFHIPLLRGRLFFEFELKRHL